MLVRDAGVERGALVPEPERSLIDNRVRGSMKKGSWD